MSGAKQRTTLTDLKEPQQMRELNRQLSWIWEQLLGGLNMKSLSAGTRKIIESKADDEEMRSVIEQTRRSITLSVSESFKTVDKEIDTLGGEVDELGQAVERNTAALSVQADKIEGKVSQEKFVALDKEVDTLDGRVGMLGEDVDALGESVDVLGQAVERNTAALSVQAGQIESKVSQESFNALGEKVNEDISKISQTAQEIMVEVKKPSAAVDTGDEGVQVKISKDRFEVNVPGEDGDFELNESGGRLPVLVSQDVSAPNVTPRYSGKTWLYVNPNATSTQIAAGTHFRSLSDAFSKLSGRYLDAEVTVNLAAGMTEYGTAVLSGVTGRGRVNVLCSAAAPAKLVGQLKLAYNGVWVYVRYLDIDTTSIGVEVESCQRVQLDYCVINGSGTGVSGSKAIYAHSGSNVTVNNCGLYGCERSLYAYSNSSIDGGNNKGNCRAAVNRAMMYLQGTQPCDQVVWTAAKWAGEVYTANVTVDQGSAAVPEGEPVTASFMMTHSDSYVTGWSYFSDNDIRQGCINSAENRIRGCMWFDNTALRSLLTGKTVQQASIKLYAATGVGRGVSVSVELYGTTAQYEGRSEAPALTKSYGTIGTVTPGEAVSITIPNQAVSDLVSGAVNGFMVYSEDAELYKERSYSRNYARFMGETSGDDATKPVLTVAYK